MEQRRRALFTLAALLLTTLGATAVLLVRGPSCGHDFDFHLVSWMEAGRAWHSGALYPHWVDSANYGAGEPRFVFYPPGSWMLGALLGTIAGWHAAPWLFTTICLLLSGFGMRRFASRWLSPPAAVAAGCLYIANPYMLFVAFERAAYGELMAAALIPLLLSLCVLPTPPAAPVAATIAGIWLVNAPSGVMAGYTLLWIALLRLACERRWTAPLRIGGASVGGLALAGFYLVPAAYEQRWVEIARAIGPGMRFQDSFLFGHTGEPYHDAVLRSASISGCVLLAVAVASAALWRRRFSAGVDDRNGRSLLWLASLVPLTLILLLPVSSIVWRYAPRLQYVQFPWRWLLVLAPIAVLLFVGAVARRARPVLVLVIAGAVCIMTLATVPPRLHQYCDEEDNVSAQVQRMRDEQGEEGTDEYTPRDVDNAEVTQDQPEVRVLREMNAEEPDSSKQQNPEWQSDLNAEVPAVIRIPQQGPEHRRITIDSPAAGFALVRLMVYPAWVVRRNGELMTDLPRRDDGLLTIPVPKGRSEIDIQWHTTPDVWAGRLLSIVGILLWAAARRLDRRSLEPDSLSAKS
jgi:uncharacterized membrane protein